jgi:ABC-type branched-subunit amino acid transport system permease subunit
MTGIAKFFRNPLVSRLLACLFGGLVLALMVGPQEGTQDDYGYAFRQAVAVPRIFVFLGIGVLLFLVLTFKDYLTPYLKRPGIRPLFLSVLTLVAAHGLLHWFDPLPNNGKFGTVADAVAGSSGASALTHAYFGWMGWTLTVLLLALGITAVVTGWRWLGWVLVVLALVGAYAAWSSHADVVQLGASLGVDHSLGAGVAVLGYLGVAASGLAIALSTSSTADTGAFIGRVMSWRPGFPLAVVGVLLALQSMFLATWWSPGTRNAGFGDTADLFQGSGLDPLGAAYLSWLAWTLVIVTALAALGACYLRLAPLGWATVLLGIAGMAITLISMFQMSRLGGELGVDGATGPWQNLGTGGWIASAAFLVLAGAGFTAATVRLRTKGEARSSDEIGRGIIRSPGGIQTFYVLIAAVALFYPPTANTFWQQVLVGEIGIYVLLAIGLNVVVGWAGLLDLGYIAFYAIGSYTTAYLVGSLPVKPPEWLHLSPLWAIPFAIGLCLLAGVLLGAPTLRLRGDYLAIVTMGFGEIIRIAAINADGLTNSTRGPQPQVPHPVINLGFFRIEWGLNQLQYWYLLLVLIVIVVVLFTKLENSRIGRAWAAIREDEIAAQATGVNTTRLKLMAFAIGASTSGVAGVFFASQIGYFNPDNFLLLNSILVVAYVVFGGMGSLPGAIAGAAVLTWLPEFLRDQVPAEDKQIWIGAIIVLMMIFRPAGLIPARRRQAELRGLGGVPRAETRAVAANEGM